MRSSLQNLTVLTVAVGLLWGCEEQVVVDDYIRTQAVLVGTVTSESGNGVEGVLVEAETWKDESWDAACPAEGGEQIGAEGNTHSASDGSYSLTFGERGVEEGTRCVVVRATAPSGSALQNASDTVPSMMLRKDGPLDSAEVDLTLPDSE